MANAPAPQHVLPFESASELREAHARLLEALDKPLERDSSVEGEAAAVAGMETQIREFLERGAATGVYLEEVKERTACQVLMDYWASTLSQAGIHVAAGRLARFDGEQLPDLKDKTCPYVGLEAFRDQAFFFGREADTQALLTQLQDTPLVVVLGASGSGKSSLVMGGVLPALAAEERRPPLCIVPPFVPGNTVLVSLADAVLQGHSGGELSAEVAALREDPGHLGAMVGGVEAPPTLITIDQFEEVFTLSDAADREALVANLAQLMQAGRGHRVILTMREEFRSRVVELRALSPYLKAAWYSMRPMGYEELRAAVEGPAALVNLQFQSGIVDDLVKKVLGQPAALPLLQFALRSLWEKRDRNRITWEVYRAVGDPLTALQSAADTFYDRLAPQTQDEVRRILLELVRVDELLEAYRQPVRKNTLLAVGKANTEEVLDLLAANEFIRIAHGPTELEAIVEIRHESLIRNWPRFVGWIDDKRRERRQRFALAQAADHWDKGGRPREGLLTGWQLQQGAEHSDLSILEREFIEASAGAIQRRQRRKERMFIAGSGFALILIACVWAFDHFYLAERRLTWGELDFLQNMGEEDQRAYAEMGLDNLAINLWEKRGTDPKSLDKLVQILKSADRRGLFKHDIYKVAAWNASEYSTSSMSSTQDTNTIVTLEYPKSVALSAPLLEFFWREYSKVVWDEGFPIPAKVTVTARDSEKSLYRVNVKRLEWPKVPGDKSGRSNAVSGKAQRNKVPSGRVAAGTNVRVRGKAAGGEAEPAANFLEKSDSRDLNFTFDPSEVLLNDIDLDPAAKALLEKYKTEWNARAPFTELNLPHWWWVPRWTIPIWKAARAKQFYPPEVGVIVHAIVQIRQQQDLLYSDGFVAGLLHWQALLTPETVRAACEASGGIDMLVNRTKSWIETRGPLSRLEDFVEDLARNTERRTIPSGDECGVAHLWDSVSKPFETAFFAQELDAAMSGAYKPEPPLRVYVAPNLQAYIARSGTLDPVVGSRVDKQLREGVLQEVGLRVPGVRFTVNTDLDQNQFTIEIHGQILSSPLLASPGHEVDDILEGLHKRLLPTRAIWLDTEEAARLTNDLPPALKGWLSKNYNVGQLGMILQEALLKGASKNPRLEADEAAEQHRESATLTHFSWLVRSLAFWKQVCGAIDIQCLGDGLRRTQLARSSRPTDTPRSIQPVTTSPGLASLTAGRLDEAAAEFAQRTHASNRASESRAFVEAYRRVALQFDYAAIEQTCTPDIGNYASHENRFGANFPRERISALLDEYGQSLPGSMRARLELCQISSLLPLASEKVRVRNLIDRQFKSVTTQWTSDEKSWLGYLALRDHLDSDEAKYKAPPRHLDEIRSLLSDAIRGLPTKTAEAPFDDLSALCGKPSSGNWCMQIFRDWPRLKSDSYWIPLTLANATNQVSRDDAHAALQFVDRAERNLSAVDRKKRQQQRAWMTYIRGSAHETLAELGVDGELDRAIRYLTGLTPIFHALQPDVLPDWSSLIESSTSTLSVALRVKGDLDQASKVISRDNTLVNKESDPLAHEEVAVLWGQGKFDEVLTLLTGKTDEGSLLLKCLSRFFIEDPSAAVGLEKDVDEVLKATNESRDYVRLIYYWHLMRKGDENEAAKLLQRRWSEINPTDLAEPPSWKPRLTAERGDYMTVWQEMLVGYFFGKVSQHQVMADLLETSRNFETSPFGRAPESRQGFLTEWHFYDALLQSVTGDRSSRVDRFRSGLEETINTKQFGYNEYSFAKALLSRIERGEDQTRRVQSR